MNFPVHPGPNEGMTGCLHKKTITIRPLESLAYTKVPAVFFNGDALAPAAVLFFSA